MITTNRMDDPLSYRLIDCGEGRRLEQIGDYLIDRPSLAHQNPKRKIKEWELADFYYESHKMDSGSWLNKSDRTFAPTIVKFKDLKFEYRLTPSGQTGIFPEQLINWNLLKKTRHQEPLKILNLFAYTGLSSITAALAGHNVCHVDASRSVVNWAKKNAKINAVHPQSIRWIVEDALTFCQRELKRKNHYDGFILDPPAFGRGLGQKTWKFQRDLPILLNTLNDLAGHNLRLIILSTHQTGWTHPKLHDLIRNSFPNLNTKATRAYDMKETTENNDEVSSGMACSYIAPNQEPGN